MRVAWNRYLPSLYIQTCRNWPVPPVSFSGLFPCSLSPQVTSCRSEIYVMSATAERMTTSVFSFLTFWLLSAGAAIFKCMWQSLFFGVAPSLFDFRLENNSYSTRICRCNTPRHKFLIPSCGTSEVQHHVEIFLFATIMLYSTFLMNYLNKRSISFCLSHLPYVKSRQWRQCCSYFTSSHIGHDTKFKQEMKNDLMYGPKLQDFSKLCL
jgi:hypothetical protein